MGWVILAASAVTLECAMKILTASIVCAMGTTLLWSAAACAQSVPAHAFTVLPPPSINAPGAKAVAPVEKRKTARPPSAAKPAAPSTAIPLPALPTMHENALRDGRGQMPPTVKVTRQKGRVIEEYYDGGQLFMVQVRPEHGPSYTYFVDKAHHVTRGPGAPKISPALFTILTWGQPDK